MKFAEYSNKIFELREQYYQLAVGKESLLTLINQAEVSEQVYNSNAIENSTLSLAETEKILQQIELDRFISERELFETKNLARVVDYIDNKAKAQELSLELILLLHQMLLTNIRNEVSGRFRVMNEHVRVGSYIAPPPSQIEGLMTQLLVDYFATPNHHIVKRVAKFHLQFEHIHPFVDGNGRIGRVLNNFLLIREGYVPINIKFVERQEYYAAFNQYDQSGNTILMENIIGRALTNSYHKRLAYLANKQIISLAQYAKQKRLSHPNLINKAKRQTIPAFLEKGIWKIAGDF